MAAISGLVSNYAAETSCSFTNAEYPSCPFVPGFTGGRTTRSIDGLNEQLHRSIPIGVFANLRVCQIGSDNRHDFVLTLS